MDSCFLTQYEESLSVCETLYQRIIKIMEIKNISINEFYERTKLDRNIMYKLKANTSRPQLKTVISVCVGLELELMQSLELIHIAGYSLIPTLKLDYAYIDIITNYASFGINVCNNRLKEIGINEKYWLGSKGNRD